jgi:hypothetical protein
MDMSISSSSTNRHINVNQLLTASVELTAPSSLRHSFSRANGELGVNFLKIHLTKEEFGVFRLKREWFTIMTKPNDMHEGITSGSPALSTLDY